MPYNQNQPIPGTTKPGATKPSSPCVKVCRLDRDQICVGCGRTLQEIAGWSCFSDSLRETLAEQAQTRLSDRRLGMDSET